MIIFESSYSQEIVEDAGGVSKIVITHPRVQWAIGNNIHCRIDWIKSQDRNALDVRVDAGMTPEQQTEYLLRFT